MDTVSVQCCVAGGGPAGMMPGLLLARAGIDVLVLEKHADFLRDFRGNTIHPSNAVAASSLLAAPLREDRLTIGDLRQVQQPGMADADDATIAGLPESRHQSGYYVPRGPLSPPFFLRLLAHFPLLRTIPPRLIGIGFRPEHVNTRSVWPE